MGFEIIKKRIPIISSGKFGSTNYYISENTLRLMCTSDKLANCCLAYYLNGEEHPVGCFSEDEHVYEEYDINTGELILYTYPFIWHDFDKGLVNEIRQGNISFTPEITINKTHEREDSSIEIDDFEILYVLAYPSVMDE